MPSGRPNVLIVVCDSLRPDLLSAYGGTVDFALLDELANRGTLFERAYAAGPGSSISHAALFSGQYPSTSGVGGQVDIPADVPLLAEHLRKAGYETFGMPGPSRMGSHWGYDRGFDEYLEKWADIPSAVSLEDLRLAINNPGLVAPMPKEILRRLRYGDDKYTSYLLDVFERKVRRLEEPYLGFINLTTVHTPYDPPRPYKRETTPELSRPRTGLGELFGGEEKFNRADIDVNGLHQAQVHEGTPRLYEDPSYLRDEEMETLLAWYRASISYLNDRLDATFRRLRSAGELENTIVVLLADHGEQFGEHDLLGHMYFHFEACLRVPFAIAGPGVPQGHHDDFISLIDVFPTVCDLADIDPPPGLEGRSTFGPPATRRSAVFAENGARPLSDTYRAHLSDESLERFSRGLKSVRTDDYLFTLDSAGEQRLYERPGETPVPLSAGPVDELHEMIHDELGDQFPPGSESDREMSAEVESNLRRLGYIE